MLIFYMVIIKAIRFISDIFFEQVILNFIFLQTICDVSIIFLYCNKLMLWSHMLIFFSCLLLYRFIFLVLIFIYLFILLLFRKIACPNFFETRCITHKNFIYSKFIYSKLYISISLLQKLRPNITLIYFFCWFKRQVNLIFKTLCNLL